MSVPANGMRSKEYDRWLEELAQSEDPDVRDIAEYAKNCNWWLSMYFQVSGETLDEVNASYPDYDLHDFYDSEEDWQKAVKQGYYTFHGALCAEWAS